MGDVKRLITPPFRLSFPNLFEAKGFEGTEKNKKFGCSAIWTPSKFTAADKKKWKLIFQALDDEAQSRFKKSWKQLKASSAFKEGIRDGADKELEGYGDGTMFASLTTQMRPGIVDIEGNRIAPEEGNQDEIYAGCFCRATVNVYSYDNKGKGVALGLMNLQKIAEGPRLDSRTDAREDFEDDEVDEAWLEESEGGDPEDDEPF